jgi:hypothetical protein
MRFLFESKLLLLSAAWGLLGDLALAQNDTDSGGAHQSTPTDDVPVTVETALGQVIGITIGAVDNFLGIQYAVSLLAWVISNNTSMHALTSFIAALAGE